MILYILFLFLNIDSTVGACAARNFEKTKLVCVCNLTFCDELKILHNVSDGYATLYETNKNGARFLIKSIKFLKNVDPGIPVLQINKSEIFQFILGFGGAFTDAAGINVKSLPSDLQKKVMKSYFSEEGLQYNMGRMPIASCDFSLYPYSYDDVPGDFQLKNFKLAKEDFLYKIPLIKEAKALGKDELLLVSSPWSAPAWMKTNNAMNGKGTLKGTPGDKYYETWASYFVRFLQEYQKNNITFWGITTQNEPTDGCLADFKFQSMCFPPEKQRDFLKLNLGPSLQKAGFGVDKLKLMIMDDIRYLLPKWVEPILDDETAAQYVSGIAVHWYQSFLSPFKLLDITRQKYPSMFFLATEACTGTNPWDFPKVDLGSWDRAEKYAKDVIKNLMHFAIGWLDWNLALDMSGGPNWVKNFADAPIIINAQANEFYKQPMYYALAHFSKFLSRGSYRIGLEVPETISKSFNDMDIAAFHTPQGKNVVIAVNRNDEAFNVFLQDVSKGYLNITISGHGIQSIMW